MTNDLTTAVQAEQLARAAEAEAQRANDRMGTACTNEALHRAQDRVNLARRPRWAAEAAARR